MALCGVGLAPSPAASTRTKEANKTEGRRGFMVFRFVSLVLCFTLLVALLETVPLSPTFFLFHRRIPSRPRQDSSLLAHSSPLLSATRAAASEHDRSRFPFSPSAVPMLHTTSHKKGLINSAPRFVFPRLSVRSPTHPMHQFFPSPLGTHTPHAVKSTFSLAFLSTLKEKTLYFTHRLHINPLIPPNRYTYKKKRRTKSHSTITHTGRPLL